MVSYRKKSGFFARYGVFFHNSKMTQKSRKRGEVALIAPILDFQDLKIYVNLSEKNAITRGKFIFFEISKFLKILIVSRRQLK